MRRRLVESRTAARRAIEGGRVVVGGVPTPKPSTLVDAGEAIRLIEPQRRPVGRGAVKLAGALERLPVPVRGRRALDVGASTGGFTEELLEAGAEGVTALDVGYGQLHWRLRQDDRVEVVERTNIRHVDPAELGAPFEVVVADLSFISLGAVAEALARLGDEGTDYLLLVKPQFELGPGLVGRGGVVRDPELHRKALEGAVDALAGAGLGVRAVAASPIEGASGNREFFVWARHGPPTVHPSALDEEVRA